MNIAFYGTLKFAKILIEHPMDGINPVCLINNSAIQLNRFKFPIVSENEYIALYQKHCDAIVIAIHHMYDVAKAVARVRMFIGGVEQIGIFTRGGHVPYFKTANEYWKRIYWVGSNEAILSHIEIHLTDICNLKCKYCFHFCNLYDKDETDLVEVEKDLQQISKHAQIFRLKLMGGEPLLCRNIVEIIKKVRNIFPFSFLELTTNGLLLPKMSEDFFVAIKMNINKLYISEYTPTTKIKAQIIPILNQYHIVYEFGKVTRFVRKLLPDNMSIPEKAYEHCGSRPCKMLRKGKIYICPLEAMVYKYIDYFTLKDKFKFNYDTLGISIYDDSYPWKNLYTDIDKASDMCGYCASGEIGGSELMAWESGVIPERNHWICSWSL